MKASYVISAEKLRSFGKGVFQKASVPREDAETAAEILVEANLRSKSRGDGSGYRHGECDVIPFGGREKFLDTNPLCCCIPAGTYPWFCMDMPSA